MSAAPNISASELGEATWADYLAAVRPRLAPGVKLIEREVLGPKTTMRVGGPARGFARPATVDELRHLLVEARRRALPVLMLGRGSNLVVPDAGVDGVVISLGHESWQK